jgi:hypothetical protein
MNHFVVNDIRLSIQGTQHVTKIDRFGAEVCATAFRFGVHFFRISLDYTGSAAYVLRLQR